MLTSDGIQQRLTTQFEFARCNVGWNMLGCVAIVAIIMIIVLVFK